MEWFSTILRGLSRPFQWWIVIAQWEQGLRVRLGKHCEKLDPGIHLRIPFLDRIYVQSIRLRTLSFTGLCCLTKDRKTAVVGISASFSINDMLRLYDSLSSPEHTVEMLVSKNIVNRIGAKSAAELNPNDLEFNLTVPQDWGISSIGVTVFSFTICRTYRLISNDYRTGSGVWNLDDSQANGERK